MKENKLSNKKERMYELQKKSTGVAIVLSIVLTGAGSMYAGKVGKGILLFCLSMFMWIFLLGWVVWIIAAFVAMGDVSNYNESLRLSLE